MAGLEPCRSSAGFPGGVAGAGALRHNGPPGWTQRTDAGTILSLLRREREYCPRASTGPKSVKSEFCR
jgi:hypothetical protein